MKPEETIHRAILNYLRWQFPKAIIHHSANEGNRGGKRGIIDGKRKQAMGQVAGYPDLTMWHEGCFWAFEIKAPKGRVSPAQRECGGAIVANGGKWAVVRSIGDVQEQINEWQDEIAVARFAEMEAKA